jgi:outer membrane biosynthesis protein TonB
MRAGILVSTMVHAAAIAVTLIAWPVPELPPVQQNPVVPVEIIEFAEETNITPIAPVQPAEDAPITPATDGAPQEAELAPPNAPPAPAPEPTPKKPPRNAPPSLDRVAALIDKSAKAGAPPAPAEAAQTGERARAGIGLGDKMALSEIDAIKAQMRECWRMPVDMAMPERLRIEVRVTFEADGQVTRTQLVRPSGFAGLDPPTRAAAEAALRAVRVCNPLSVAPTRTQGGQVVLNFDPREMAAR